jgi:hypothetical protein
MSRYTSYDPILLPGDPEYQEFDPSLPSGAVKLPNRRVVMRKSPGGIDMEFKRLQGRDISICQLGLTDEAFRAAVWLYMKLNEIEVIERDERTLKTYSRDMPEAMQ